MRADHGAPRRSFGKFVTQNTVWGLEKFGFVPKGTHDVGEALKTAGASRLRPSSQSGGLTLSPRSRRSCRRWSREALYPHDALCLVRALRLSRRAPGADDFSVAHSRKAAE